MTNLLFRYKPFVCGTSRECVITSVSFIEPKLAHFNINTKKYQIKTIKLSRVSLLNITGLCERRAICALGFLCVDNERARAAHSRAHGATINDGMNTFTSVFKYKIFGIRLEQFLNYFKRPPIHRLGCGGWLTENGLGGHPHAHQHKTHSHRDVTLHPLNASALTIHIDQLFSQLISLNTKTISVLVQKECVCVWKLHVCVCVCVCGFYRAVHPWWSGRSHPWEDSGIQHRPRRSAPSELAGSGPAGTPGWSAGLW